MTEISKFGLVWFGLMLNVPVNNFSVMFGLEISKYIHVYLKTKPVQQMRCMFDDDIFISP